MKYAFTDKLGADLYAGYLKHKLSADNLLNTAIFGDFSGDVWRATLSWQPSDKTQLQFAGWHELHAFLADASNYFISKGLSIAPTWKPTEKISVAFAASRENQDYVAIQSVLGIAAPPRNDRVVAEQINVYWLPRQRWAFNAFLRNERRTSSDPNLVFNDVSGNLSFTYKFL